MTYLQTLPEYGLKLDFRPKFPFWGGLGRIRALPHWVRSHSLNSLVYQRVLAAVASRTFLKTALRLCRSFVGQGSLSHGLSCASVIVVTGWCDEKSQRGLVWGIRLLPLRSALLTTVTVGCAAASRATLRLSPSTSLGASAKQGRLSQKA